MNKMMKQKNSTQTLRNIKPQKMKESYTISSRTPKEHIKSSNRKKGSMHKFKSIPTIAYRQPQYSNLPSEKYIHQSYTNNQTCRALLHSTQTEPQLLNSISDRNHSGSKISLHSKLNFAQKETRSSKNKTNHTLKTRHQSKCPHTLNDIFKRTKNAVDLFRKKQEAWKKEKAYLMKEIQKFKIRSHGKKNISNFCVKGLKSA